MSTLYVDTSAVLRAILETGTTPEVETAILAADVLITSRLSLVESARTFHRLRLLDEIPEGQMTRLQIEAEDFWAHCELWELTPEICGLASALESDKALRSLDALHLATFLRARRDLPDLETLLTVDDRLEYAFKYHQTIEESPAPDYWRSLEELLGGEKLAALLGISVSSVRRYRNAERSTPDGIAARLHFLATVVGDLAGAYNGFGIRRWFDRRRSLLEGRSPAELLEQGWSPEDEGACRVRELARSLGAAAAT